MLRLIHEQLAETHQMTPHLPALADKISYVECRYRFSYMLHNSSDSPSSSIKFAAFVQTFLNITDFF